MALYGRYELMDYNVKIELYDYKMVLFLYFFFGLPLRDVSE